MDKLKRLNEESDFEYKVRLCNMKLNKEMDLDWCEIVELLGLGISSDHLRKLSYAYKEYNEYIGNKKINNIADDELLRKYEEKILELKTERKKLSLTKSEYNRNFNKDITRELLYENIKDSKDLIPLPKFEPLFNGGNKSEHILAWSDLHYGANFVSENNNYSREECKRRFEVLVGHAKKIIEMNNINKLHIIGLGDDIQGLLRISDVRLNDIPVVESVVEVSRLISLVLTELSKTTEVVYYHTMASNHSQTRAITGKPDLVKEDLQVIIGNWIKDLTLQNNRIEVVLSKKDYNSVTIANQNILVLHGHQVKNVKTVVRDYSMLHQKFYNIVFMGHYHAGMQSSVGENDYGNIETVVVPSFVGSCPYSDSLLVGSKAMAKYYKLEEGYGIVEQRTIVLN